MSVRLHPLLSALFLPLSNRCMPIAHAVIMSYLLVQREIQSVPKLQVRLERTCLVYLALRTLDRQSA